MAQPDATPEFSRLVPLTSIDRRGFSQTIEASPAERTALAERFGLIALDRLVADVRLRPVNGGTAIRLDARITADCVQRCTATLEPLPVTVAEEFALLYSAEARTGGDLDIEYADEVLEPLDGDSIDIGEAVAQELSLALDPFPRAPGATPEDLDGAAPGLSEDRHSSDGALAALARWNRSGGRDG
ncbi:MAG: DUF177 domain-containing protein [Alphaproteobacteria bacterium]